MKRTVIAIQRSASQNPLGAKAENWPSDVQHRRPDALAPKALRMGPL